MSSDRDKMKKRIEYFKEFRSVVDKKAVYMLNIFEIEVYLLCDLDTFMAHYNCTCSCEFDPHEVREPKEHLKSLCKYN